MDDPYLGRRSSNEHLANEIAQVEMTDTADEIDAEKYLQIIHSSQLVLAVEGGCSSGPSCP
jgi:hypothetical protein